MRKAVVSGALCVLMWVAAASAEGSYLSRSWNRGAIRLTASVPLLARVSGYLFYYNGYGESLLDYNAHSNRFGVGFILKEW